MHDYAQQQEEIKALRIEIKQTAHQNSNYRAHTDNDKFILGIKSGTHADTVSKRVRCRRGKAQAHRSRSDPAAAGRTALRSRLSIRRRSRGECR